jgi:hypothetical protein
MTTHIGARTACDLTIIDFNKKLTFSGVEKCRLDSLAELSTELLILNKASELRCTPNKTKRLDCRNHLIRHRWTNL